MQMQNSIPWQFCIIAALFVWLVITLIYRGIANHYAKRECPIELDVVLLDYFCEGGTNKHGLLVCKEINSCEVVKFLDKHREHQQSLEAMIGESHIVYVSFSFTGLFIMGVGYILDSIK